MRTASSSRSRMGDAVIAVGNAGGDRRLTWAKGTVTGTPASRSSSVTGSAATARLTGLIATIAAVQPGDSGGPLVDSRRPGHRHQHGRVERVRRSARRASDGYARARGPD